MEIDSLSNWSRIYFDLFSMECFMDKEILRQIVHLSGLLFVFIAQFLDKWASAAMFLIIGAFFFTYGEYVKRKTNAIFGLRKLPFFFERKKSRPFAGAFWFYIGCGISFILFPHIIASAASSVLAIGDSLSTLIGREIGNHKLIGNKSLEGTLAFFVFSFFLTLFFVKPFIGMVGALIGALVELSVPDKLAKKTSLFLDDNFLIPIISGSVMFGLGFVL